MNKKQYKKIKLRIKLLTLKLDDMIKKCKADTKNIERVIKGMG